MRRLVLYLVVMAAAAVLLGAAKQPRSYPIGARSYGGDSYPRIGVSADYVRASVAFAIEGDDPVVTVKTRQDTNHTLRIDVAYLQGSGGGGPVARTIVHGDTASAYTDRHTVSVDLDSIAGTWAAYGGDTVEVWVRIGDALAKNVKQPIPALDDGSAPTIADTSGVQLLIAENGGAGTFTVSATADEDASWELQAIVNSNYPDWGDTNTDHWQWKARAQGVHDRTSAGYDDSLTAFVLSISDGLYRLDDLVVRLRATDAFDNASDWFTIYDGTMESLIDAGAGTLPASDEYQWSVYLQDGQIVPDDASIAEWSEVPLMLCQTDHILGTEAAANAGYEHWIADARAEAGAKELVVVAHGGEHCQFNTTSPFAKRKWYWAEFAYDSLMTADDTTNAFIHRYDGELAHYRNSATFYRGPIVNFADEDGRRLFARFTATELAYADNLVDYVGLFYDVWDPSRGYAIYNTDSTSALNATLGYDCDRDGDYLGIDADEQELRWNGFNSWFNVLRQEIAFAGLDTSKIILGANSDVIVSHEAHLGNLDFLYIEDFGCPSVAQTPWRDAPYHTAVDASYYQPSAADGFDLLYGSDYPDPGTYIASWFDLTTDMRTDIGPFVVTERRSGYYQAEHPVQLEVWGLFFDDIYPEWTDWTTGSQYRSYNTPADSGFDDLSQLGAASGAASVDSSTYTGFVEITRSFASGEARIFMPERSAWDCEADSLEYCVWLTGSDTLRISDGYDITSPVIETYTIAAWDSGGAGTTLRASLSAELDESSLFRARSATSYGGLISAEWETLSTSWTSQSDWHNTGLSPYDGFLYVQVSALDIFGNEATDNDNTAVSRPVPADETAPTLTFASITYDEGTETVSGNVTADEAYNGRYRWYVGAAPFESWSAYPDTYSTDQTWVVSGLGGESEAEWVRIEVGGKDAAENVSTTVTDSVQIDRTPSAPSGLAVSDSMTSTQLTIGWTDPSVVDVDSLSIYYSETSGSGYTLFASGVDVTAETADITGLTNGTTYFIVLTVTDNSDQESAYSTEIGCSPEDGGSGATQMLFVFSNSSSGYTLTNDTPADNDTISYEGGGSTWIGEIHEVTNLGTDIARFDAADTAGTIGGRLDITITDGLPLDAPESFDPENNVLWFELADSLLATDNVTAARLVMRVSDIGYTGSTSDSILVYSVNISNFGSWGGNTDACYAYETGTTPWGTHISAYTAWPQLAASVSDTTGITMAAYTWFGLDVTAGVEAWVESEDPIGGFWIDGVSAGSSTRFWIDHHDDTTAGERPYLMVWIER